MGTAAFKVKLHEESVGWFGHVKSKNESHITRQAMEVIVEKTRLKETPMLTWLNKIKGDLMEVSAQWGCIKREKVKK